jgi:hypothetical protein
VVTNVGRFEASLQPPRRSLDVASIISSWSESLLVLATDGLKRHVELVRVGSEAGARLPIPDVAGDMPASIHNRGRDDREHASPRSPSTRPQDRLRVVPVCVKVKRMPTKTENADLHTPWDPLEVHGADQGLVLAAQRREITNILKSYTGYYDLFAEMIQNALDAVERRKAQNPGGPYLPRVRINIDMKEPAVSVMDNGCGMDLVQFQQFMKPNYSFKDSGANRGSKGVGATYLAYGFNLLEVATRQNWTTRSGRIANGRVWVEDHSGTVHRPKVQPDKTWGADFEDETFDSGTLMRVRLTGTNIRPKDLNWVGATTALQWATVLRITTPLGGVYILEQVPLVKVDVTVRAPDGTITSHELDSARYLFPHLVLGKNVDLREYLADQKKRAEKSESLSKVPPKFTKQNGMWGEWTGDQILAEDAVIRPRLDQSEKDLLKAAGVRLYGYLGYSTELWDAYNDGLLKLRKGLRLLRGGLQLSTRHMPQGNPLTIPLTKSIGLQNIAHVVVHFENAEPDLGRKGFQPELAQLAGKLAVSTVNAFSRHMDTLLKKSTGVPALQEQMKLNLWLEEQKLHEKNFPLVISGKGLFQPTEELPIRSLPLVEQDVVALFNQMLSSGLVRGIQVLASSQFQQYDALFRVKMTQPFDRYVRSDQNPLGIDHEMFDGGPIEGPVSVLEYKYSLDALVEEFQTEMKSPTDIKLVVCWKASTKWKADFEIVSYLDPDHVHLRPYHGLTHGVSHAKSGLAAFGLIVLEDLIGFLQSPGKEIARQKQLFGETVDLDE